MSDELPTLGELISRGPARAAAFWLERLDRDEVSGQEELFERWLGVAEGNRAEWERALDLWQSLDDLGDGDIAELRAEALRFRTPAHRMTIGRVPLVASIAAMSAGVIAVAVTT